MTDDPVITEEQVREALRPVTDPEIGLSILDLGLVYGIGIDQKSKTVTVTMTLTSQMCPMGPQILGASEMAVRRVPGVEKVKIDLVWEPRWDPRVHASEDGKAYLGIWS
jgi:metal-sulfur cluster biosynthetic enzyme